MYNQQAQSRWFTNNQWSLIDYTKCKQISVPLDKLAQKPLKFGVFVPIMSITNQGKLYFTFFIMNSTSKSLFQQAIDLTDDYLSFDYERSFRSNMFDKYTRNNNFDPYLSIYHYGGDKFVVQTTNYDTSKGCTIGTSITLGVYNDILEAQDCAEDYLKDLVMSQGV